MGTVKYTGPVASFHCPTNAEIRSLKVHFSPKQEGSGDPSPENVRPISGWDGVDIWQSGKNLFNINVPFQNPDNIKTSFSEKRIFAPNSYCVGASFSNYFNDSYIDSYEISDNVLTVNSRQGYSVGFAFALTPGFSYFISATTKGSSPTIEIANYSQDGTFLQRSTTNYLNRSFVVPEDAKRTVLCFRGSPSGGDAIFSNIQLELGTFANHYEPYQGSTTDYEFGVLGKNKFDNLQSPFKSGQYIHYDSTVGKKPVYSTHTNYNVYSIPILKNTTYTISGIKADNPCSGLIDNQGIFTYVRRNNGSTNGTSWSITTGENDEYLLLSVAINDTYKCDDILQLELGSTATTYESYDPKSIVYGGWVDLISGEVQEEWGQRILNGSETWNKQNPNTTYNLKFLTSFASDGIQSLNIFVNWICPISTGNATEMYIDGNLCCRLGWSDKQFYVLNAAEYLDEVTDIASFKEYLSNHNLQVVYPLAAPTTYHIAPTALQTFLGQNNVWSNADYVEVEYDLHETQSLLQRKAFIMANQPHIVKPAAASLQNFKTDVIAPLKECKVHFGPVQEGTGDPSPDNVRAINGWTGCEVYRTGKNLLNEAFLSDYANYSIVGNYGYRYTEPIFLNPNTEYKFSFTTPQTYETTRYWAVKVYDDTYANINDIGTVRYLVNNKVTADWGIITGAQGVIRFAVYGGQATLDDIWNNTTVQLELGSTATSYEPYTGTTLPIDWTTEAGTVYGGYVDLASGEVWKTHEKINLPVTAKQGTWDSATGKGAYWYTSAIQTLATTNDGVFCNRCKTQIVTSLDDTSSALTWYANGIIRWIDIGTMEMTVAEYRDYLAENPLQVTYKLNSPVLLGAITPSTLKTLRGTNNIWSNANGNIELAYWSH